MQYFIQSKQDGNEVLSQPSHASEDRRVSDIRGQRIASASPARRYPRVVHRMELEVAKIADADQDGMKDMKMGNGSGNMK